MDEAVKGICNGICEQSKQHEAVSRQQGVLV